MHKLFTRFSVALVAAIALSTIPAHAAGPAQGKNKAVSEIVARYHGVENKADAIRASRDWLPSAKISAILKFGHGQPDDSYEFKLHSAGPAALWKSDPKYAKLSAGYVEKSRSKPTTKLEKVGKKWQSVTKYQVDYMAKGFTGKMQEVETITLIKRGPGLKISNVKILYDFR